MPWSTGKIMGLDHIPTVEKKKKFAYVIINKFGEKEEAGVVELGELNNIIKKNKIEIVAIDNVFELYPNSRSIINFVKNNNIRLIQVTGRPGNMVKLSFLARQAGLFKRGKLNPQQSAEISAKLALMGIGAELHIFEDATKVIISRSRSLGEGGQHQVKYARSIASLILQTKRKIKKILDDNGFLYEIFVREGDKGLKGAKFIIYAPYNNVRKFIKNVKNDLYQVKVMPLTREKIAFTPVTLQHRKNKYLICGIDPGDYTGLAIMDLNGNVVHVESRKEWSFLDVLKRIYEFGSPVIISTDVPKVPQTIEKIAKKTKAIIFHPMKTLTLAEKHELVRKLNVNARNSHERDALAAAFLAYKKYRNQFEKIDMILSYLPFNLDSETVKRDFILGTPIKDSISRLINVNIEKKVEESISNEGKEINNIPKIRELKEEIANLLRKISELQNSKRELEFRVEELKRENYKKNIIIEKLKEEIVDLKSKLSLSELRLHEAKQKLNEKELFEEITKLRNIIINKDEKIRELQQELEKYRLIALRKPEEIPVKVLRHLTISEIEYLQREIGVGPGDVIYVIDPSGGGRRAAKTLIELGIRAVILGENNLPNPAREEFEKANIPIITSLEIVKELEKLKPNEIKLLSKNLIDKFARKYMEKREAEKEMEEDEIEAFIEKYRLKRKKYISKLLD